MRRLSFLLGKTPAISLRAMGLLLTRGSKPAWITGLLSIRICG
nr:MAG TPA: hypothetical protein [Caudoviricetes sp.]